MRAIWITRHGGPEVLEVRDGPDPQPGPGQVRVRTRAVGLNFSEVSARQGIYPDAPKPPCVVGYEGAGVVDAVGEGVDPGRLGQRVLFLVPHGAHAEAVCVPDEQAIPIDEAMPFEQAAALPVAYLTAYHALFRVARIRPGDTLLVHMAAGGVGTAMLQLARTVPDVTVLGTASASKHAHVLAQGATHVIDYHREDYVEAVRKLTDGRGVDFVFDPLGGDDWRKGYSLLRPSGMLVAFGLANAARPGRRSLLRVARTLWRVPRYSVRKLLEENRAIAGVHIGHLWTERAMLASHLHAVLDAWRAGAVRPYVGSIHPFERAREAFAELEHGRNVGKIVLVP
ncbi:MAG: medium chain dehydrogenase/reductase family protein [Myxococcota bacterium]|nr:medium chain dehydrogenase/reductase family protein [Myxococcota bacterium]MDW8363656.1 medium chain dehydrogenase/reductase family protein [Myxococcales bacterium]